MARIFPELMEPKHTIPRTSKKQNIKQNIQINRIDTNKQNKYKLAPW